MITDHPLNLDEQFKMHEPDVAEVMARYQWDELTPAEKDVVRQVVKVANGKREGSARHAR